MSMPVLWKISKGWRGRTLGRSPVLLHWGDQIHPLKSGCIEVYKICDLSKIAWGERAPYQRVVDGVWVMQTSWSTWSRNPQSRLSSDPGKSKKVW
jgi:hypothetical protein